MKIRSAGVCIYICIYIYVALFVHSKIWKVWFRNAKRKSCAILAVVCESGACALRFAI